MGETESPALGRASPDYPEGALGSLSTSAKILWRDPLEHQHCPLKQRHAHIGTRLHTHCYGTYSDQLVELVKRADAWFKKARALWPDLEHYRLVYGVRPVRSTYRDTEGFYMYAAWYWQDTDGAEYGQTFTVTLDMDPRWVYKALSARCKRSRDTVIDRWDLEDSEPPLLTEVE